MSDVFVLAEHRQGELRDITLEMLTVGKELASKAGGNLCAVLLGSGVDNFAEKLKTYANQVLVVDDARLENFNSETYQKVVSDLIAEKKPLMVLIGHTSFGMDLAPALAAALDLPIATDVIGIDVDGSNVKVVRQIYAGKVNADMALKPADTHIITVRAAAFKPDEQGTLSGEIVKVDADIDEIAYKKFIEYVEAAVGDVDITQADILVSVGRGISDVENIPMVEELAEMIGGVVSCSRPVVDKNWLPKDRQVGTSGKTVKPKLYIALGISGAFQHLAGMSAADTIIAVNKDPKAPIFGVADYGIVNDLFKVVPELKNKITEIKGA